MGIVVIDIDDSPSPMSARAYIEKNAIALLSATNYSFNFSTAKWLGNYCDRREIEESCLWNVNYINSQYEKNFIDVFREYSEITTREYERNNRFYEKG